MLPRFTRRDIRKRSGERLPDVHSRAALVDRHLVGTNQFRSEPLLDAAVAVVTSRLVSRCLGNTALLTDPWVGSVGEDGAVAAQAEHCERDEGVG
jgi:hypothetical protein